MRRFRPGERLGRITIVSRGASCESRIVRCDCGVEKEISMCTLRDGERRAGDKKRILGCVCLGPDGKAKRARSTKKFTLKRKYGLTIEGLEQMRAKQNHECAICGSTGYGRALVVDHDHTYGFVRGLLCHFCNSLLGYARDSRAVLVKAIEYLGGSPL